MAERIRESEEMYLETILLLDKAKGNVRSVDIVNERNFAKSSVSRAVNLLQDRGYVNISVETGVISLTQSGRAKAQNIYDRHRVLTEMLVKLGASKDVAEDNACRIEHVISEDLFELIKSKIEIN